MQWVKVKVKRILENFKKGGNQFAVGLIHAATGESEYAVQHFLNIDDWDDWPTLSIYHLYPNILKPVRNHPQFPEIIKAVEKSRGKR